jgi:hypothetical protein
MPLRNVMVNSRVQVSCVIEEGDPPFHIRWFRDDRPLLHHHVASSVGPGTDPPSMVRLPPVQSGLRLTDFNSYSSILTIDQVLPNFIFKFVHFSRIFYLIRIYPPSPISLPVRKIKKLGDGQSRRQLLVPRFERRWHGRSRHFAPSQR